VGYYNPFSSEQANSFASVLIQLEKEMRPLRRGMRTAGSLFGFGYRKDYSVKTKLKELTTYEFKTKNGQPLSKGNPQLWQKGAELASALHLVLMQALPHEGVLCEAQVLEQGLPHLGQSWVSTCFGTVDYESETHLDTKDNGKHLAVGGWFVEMNGCGCGKSCLGDQFFLLSSYRVAIRLCHNTMIIWNSEVVPHGTSLAMKPEGCKAQRIATVTQTKRDFVSHFLRNYGE